MMWSAPATDNMLATSLAEIGARLCECVCVSEYGYNVHVCVCVYVCEWVCM